MNPVPLDYDDAQRRLHTVAQQIRDAEQRHRDAIEKAADAESAYRKGLAQSFVRHRADGKGAGEAELLAKGDVADLTRARDINSGMVRACLEELEDRRGDRASLHRLVEWSAKVNALAEPHEPLRRAA
jgi:hypothetical protein